MKRNLIFSAALVIGVFAMASCIQPTPAAPWVPAGCYDSGQEHAPDVKFSGVENQVGNAQAFIVDVENDVWSVDGSCSGDVAATGTIVRAPNAAAAISVCDSLGITGLENIANLSANGYAFPGNAWTCLEQP